MSRFSRIVVLFSALASLFAVMSSTAGAVTWTNSGGTNFHATGGPATLSTGGTNNMACSGLTATGTAPMTSFTSTIATGTLVFSPCSLVGQNSFLHCTYTLTGIAAAGGMTSSYTDVTCDARLTAAPATSLCHVSGSFMSSTYFNPSALIPGRLHVASLVQVSNGAVSCPLGTGTGSMAFDFAITSVAQSPIMARDN
jgi:hypothetical protein